MNQETVPFEEYPTCAYIRLEYNSLTESSSDHEEKKKQKSFCSERGGKVQGRTRSGGTDGHFSFSVNQFIRGNGHNAQPSKGLRYS